MLKSKSFILFKIFLISIIVTSFIFPLNICFGNPEQKYVNAETCYLNLKQDLVKQKYRHSWQKCINKYKEIFKNAGPSHAWAAAGMYRCAEIYLELYKKSFDSNDKLKAIDLFQRIINRYPLTVYKTRSEKILNRIKKKNSKKIESKKKLKFQKSNKKKIKIKKLYASKNVSKISRDISKKTTIITGLRFWSNPEYTRIVIDASKESSFTYKFLKKDFSLKKPQRLYIDFHKTKLGRNVSKHTTINDELLIQARAGQHSPNLVRIVVDIKSFSHYKIFPLQDPFRLVLDVWAEKTGKQQSIKTHKTPLKPTVSSHKTTKIPSSSSNLAKQFALGVKTIVIDPGHGGKDSGALGYLKNVQEKDIVLKLSRKLAQKIRNRLKCNVILTRTKDNYLTLEERTAIANTKKADLFISIHCNAAKSRKLNGIETYYLNLATDNQSIAVAARENATSKKNISDLDSILNDLMKSSKINESSRLASDIQNSMYLGIKKKYSKINNLGVKQAPFYVLIGASMPSILIETGFISNKKECQRLINTKYNDNLCNSIVNGLEKYIKNIKR